jgi:mono/diheme cytochrome c family protein
MMRGAIPGVALLAPLLAGSAAAADGAAIFQQYCSVCHGDRGDGRSHAGGSMVPAPRDLTSPQAVVELDRERMLRAVREGRPGTAMAAWGNQLSEEQIAAVVDHIRTRLMSAALTAGSDEGRRLYAANCSVCHGDSGEGAVWTRANMNPAPRNFTAQAARQELTRERMIRSATFGRPDTAMPGFGAQLSAEQIASIVDYIRSAFMQAAAQESPAPAPAAAEAGPDMAAGLPRGLLGDAQRGRAYYTQNCVACHGTAGDGQGPRAYFIIPKPRNFTHPASRQTLNRPALFEAIAMGRVGSEMPAWSKVLDDQAIADLAEYVFRSFIRPESTGPG